MIRISGVHKFFNKGKSNEIHVINDVSFELPDKGIVALFGKSGSGKTTLFNALGGLADIAEGEIEIDGKNLAKKTDYVRNKYIGYIFQNYNLDEKQSVFNNVADALRLVGIKDEEELNRRVTNALANVGMEKFVNRKPGTLSGGQQQRVAIARAIVKNPAIILADEPTGNLDENNTIMIMDLLKEISREHLVILVTHEAHLVDSYCDRVIELRDGQIINQYENEDANGLNARNKNHLYLGEYDREVNNTNYGEIEFYGEMPKDPVKIQIVNHNGTMYLKINNNKVALVDGTNEIKFMEGKFEDKAKKADSKKFVIEPLEEIDEKKVGKLFDFKTTVKREIQALKLEKKSSKRFRKVMRLFAFICVMLCAVYGTALKTDKEAKSKNNSNVIYMQVIDKEGDEKLKEIANDDDSAIDNFYYTYAYDVDGDDKLELKFPEIEDSLSNDTGISSFHAVNLPVSFIDKDAEYVAGKAAEDDNQIVITTNVADQIIKDSKYDFIKDYDSLIGFTYADDDDYEDDDYYSDDYYYDDYYYDDYYYDDYDSGDSGRTIVGIIESEEPSIYSMDDVLITERVNDAFFGTGCTVAKASDSDIDVKEGTVNVAVSSKEQAANIKKGDTVTVYGQQLSVNEAEVANYTYEDWLEDNNIVKLSYDEYKDESLADPMIDYLDYYYDLIVKYARYCVGNPGRMDGENEAYIEAAADFGYENRCCAIAKLANYPKYYSVKMYQSEYEYGYGYSEYDTDYDDSDYDDSEYDDSEYDDSEYDDTEYSNSQAYDIDEQEILELYNFDYECRNIEECYSSADVTYLLSDADYTKILTSFGNFDGYGFDIEDYSEDYGCYAVIHTSDSEKTADILKDAIDELSKKNKDYLMEDVLVTPDTLYKEIIAKNTGEGTVKLAIGMILVLIMSLCMYLIMNSEMMSEIKDIGMYRSIGVSKKNILYKYECKIMVLFAHSSLVGYVIASGIITYFRFGNRALSGVYDVLFYYPWWMALLVLVVTFGMTSLFGLLPVFSLLRKSPSDIMAKYDV